MLEFLDLSHNFHIFPFVLWFGRISSPFPSVLNAVLLESGVEEQISLPIPRQQVKYYSCAILGKLSIIPALENYTSYHFSKTLTQHIFQEHLHQIINKKKHMNILLHGTMIIEWYERICPPATFTYHRLCQMIKYLKCFYIHFLYHLFN